MRFAQIALVLLLGATTTALAAESEDAQTAACKKAMNTRIQVCADACTSRALAAASEYKDTNNNVKFGCLKGCAIRQVFQMQVCRGGGTAAAADPTETNRH